jgi:DNA-3-methyladenine glycosylase
MEKLPREFYMRNTLEVARDVLGKCIIHDINGEKLSGRIVEAEAYIGPNDKAAHSYNYRRTERNEVMYGPPGYAYIFVIYGMHYCMNIVTGEADHPEAILIRALEPLRGLDTMTQNRYGKMYDELNKTARTNLTNGPGKLCRAMGIDKSNYGDDLCGSRLYLAADNTPQSFSISTSPRINIDYAEEAILYPWRYYIKDNPYVSHK